MAFQNNLNNAHFYEHVALKLINKKNYIQYI